MYELTAKSDRKVDMMLHGTIAESEKINAADFGRAMNSALAMNAQEINLRIHSPGGNPFEGIAMGTKITECRAKGVKVNAIIEGMAASMMSALCCFCDKVFIAKHARMMIHQSAGIAIGSASQVIRYGKLMQTINDTLAEIYSGKTGQEEKWVKDNWMAEGKDQWFTDQEAVDAKLADEVIGETKVKALAAEGGTYFQMAAHYDQFFKTNNDEMKKEEILKLLPSLKAEATDQEILAALTEAMKSKATATPPAAGDDKTKLVDNLVALAKERGMTEEKQITALKKLAETDMSAAMDLLPAVKKEAETTVTAPVNLKDVLTLLKGDGKAGPEDRTGWTFDQWEQKDPAGFAALLKEKPKEYIKLFNAKFGYEPTEAELKKVS